MYASKAVQINPLTKHTHTHFHISSHSVDVEGPSSCFAGTIWVLCKALDIFSSISSGLEARKSYSHAPVWRLSGARLHSNKLQNSNSITETLILSCS